MRLVDHLDTTAAAQVRSIYGRRLEPRMVVVAPLVGDALNAVIWFAPI